MEAWLVGGALVQTDRGVQEQVGGQELGRGFGRFGNC